MSVMFNGPLPVRVVAGSAVHALAHLASIGAGDPEAGEPLRDALEVIGDPTGLVWEHLYGLCLDLSEPTLPVLVQHVGGLDAGAVRDAVLGLTAWSWVYVAGADRLRAAAGGDGRAQRELLHHDRYYAGMAPDALARIMPMTAAATKDAVLAALTAYAEAFGERSAQIDETLASRAAHIPSAAVLETVERWSGYRYVREPEADSVAVLLHARDGTLCLAQHDGVRLIVVGLEVDLDRVHVLTRLGCAVSDETRVRLLAMLARGPARLGELIDAAGVGRSTVHHHLAVLRDAGLVAFEGNARSYRYRIHPDAAANWSAAFGPFSHLEEETAS